jgi:fumarate hydratase, class I
LSVIRQDDFIKSISDALQFISYYHPPDFIQALYQAYLKEQSPAAKDAIAQILINSRLCAEGRRPICQDTGIVTVFLKIGMHLRWDADMDVYSMVNEGVRQAYLCAENPLRASILSDPAGKRINTKDNTPAVIHMEVVAGNSLEVNIAAKGGGSEAKAKFVMLNPADNITDWVLKILPGMGAGWCPPGILGIGIGGTAEKAMILAKQACMQPIDIQVLINRGPSNNLEELRLDIYEKVNALGIGAQGLGGLSTVLDVKILDYPTHAANKPVAMIPNCAATRHVHFILDGSGSVQLEPPKLNTWPIITQSASESRRVNLDFLSKENIIDWQSGETLLISGTLLTGRDAAHKRIFDLLGSGQPLPEGLDFKNKFIYYVGPVDAVGKEVVGPAGPTTATRMDDFTDFMLERTGLLGMIGKAERGLETISAIHRHQSVYLIAVGGAAYLVSKAIRQARVIAFPELGMEAVYEFVVEDMPVTVAVDSRGSSIHHTAPAFWQEKIAKLTFPVRQQ